MRLKSNGAARFVLAALCILMTIGICLPAVHAAGIGASPSKISQTGGKGAVYDQQLIIWNTDNKTALSVSLAVKNSTWVTVTPSLIIQAKSNQTANIHTVVPQDAVPGVYNASILVNSTSGASGGQVQILPALSISVSTTVQNYTTPTETPSPVLGLSFNQAIVSIAAVVLIGACAVYYVLRRR